MYTQSDHSPDNVKLQDNSLMVRDTPRGTPHVKCYSYHARTSTKYWEWVVIRG